MKIARIIVSLIIGLCVPVALHAERYSVETGQFEKLKINGNLSVVYKNLPDSTGYAYYTAPEGNGDVFSFSTKSDGTLKVEPADDRWGAPDLPVLHLYSDFLSSVESYSDQSVEIESLAPCASFNINLVGNGSVSVENVKCNNVAAAITTGNGSIYITGICLNANFRMVGTGLISADQLRADNVKCRILGTGSIGCWPIENLNVTGLGTTKIYYKGSPNINKKGGGKLFELPESMDEDAYARLGTEVKSLNEPDENFYEDREDEDMGFDESEEEEEDYQTVVTEDD